jgi:hypothetical protein
MQKTSFEQDIAQVSFSSSKPSVSEDNKRLDKRLDKWLDEKLEALDKAQGTMTNGEYAKKLFGIMKAYSLMKNAEESGAQSSSSAYNGKMFDHPQHGKIMQSKDVQDVMDILNGGDSCGTSCDLYSKSL